MSKDNIDTAVSAGETDTTVVEGVITLTAEELETKIEEATKAKINDVVSSRVNEINEKWESKIQTERAEAERLSKLSAEEREKEFEKQKNEELSKRDQEISIRENKILAYETFQEKGIPTKLVDLILDKDRDVMNANIEALSTTFNEAVTEAVQNKFKQEAPKDPSVNNDISSQPEPVKYR